VLLDENVWLEGGQEYFVRGRLLKGESISRVSEGVFQPNVVGLSKRGLAGAHALVDISRQYCPVRIVNSSNARLQLYKNTCLGEVELLDGSNALCYSTQKCQNNPSNMQYLQKVFENDITSLPEGDRPYLIKILSEFSDIFSQSKFDIGVAHQAEHKIDTGDSQPVAQNYRRVPRGVEEKVDELVDQLLQHNIIRPSCSPWNAPIVVVAKKNGDIRMCVDYRRLNSVTKRPIFPIPDAQQLFDTLDDSAWFSTLDLSQGYHQVPVALEDIEKTAFTTRKGQFEYLRMPFGLCSAPATFQRLMHTILQKENWTKCLIYLDDILVFGKNAEEHNERLRTVLQRIREAGLKLSPEKCHLFRKEVSYLGHVISTDGVKTAPEKIEKVKNARAPENADELRTFLGLSGYYRRFIKDYAMIVAPLEKLCHSTWNKKTRKKKKVEATPPWEWTQEHDKIFQHLKYCLTHAPVLCFPTKDGTYILDTDASHMCVGAVLSQMQNGEEKVIAYASNKLTKGERNYCITRKELLAIYKYVIHFKHYLYGRRFTVRTDHQALTWLLNWDRPNTSQYCSWRAELECYNMEVLYRPGQLHQNADALSRLPQCEQCEIQHADPQKRRNVKITHQDEGEVERVICKLSQASNNWNQETDPEIKPILDLLKSRKLQEQHPKELNGQSKATKILWEKRKHLRMRGGLLHMERKEGVYALIIPRDNRKMLVKTTHHVLGHVGVTKTTSALQDEYYWPGMAQDIRLWLNTCGQCLQRKSGNAGQLPEMQHTITGFPFEKIAIDVTGPLTATKNGDRYILGVVDYFSKYPMLIPIRNMEARTVAEALFGRWISIFGAPHCIHSDRGTCFEAAVFKELCELFNIKKTRTAPYYPQSDGLIERLFRTVKDMIYATTQTYKTEWNKVLPIVEMGLRGTVQATIKVSPHEVIFGYPMRLPIKWMAQGPGRSSHISQKANQRQFYSEYIMELQSRFKMIRDRCLPRNNNNKDECKKREVRPLEIDSLVMARIFPIEKSIANPRYDGPYRVSRKVADWTYELTHVKTGAIIHRNYHHLKRCEQIYETDTKPGDINAEAPQRVVRQRAPPQRYGFSGRGNVL
jgi:transposase InsO family protein